MAESEDEVEFVSETKKSLRSSQMDLDPPLFPSAHKSRNRAYQPPTVEESSEVQYAQANTEVIEIDFNDDRPEVDDPVFGRGRFLNVEDYAEPIEAEIRNEILRARAIPKLTQSSRNQAVDLPWLARKEITWKNIHLRPGKTVEFENGSFLRIAVILLNLQTDEIRLRGILLKRCSTEDEMEGMFLKKLNDMYLYYEVDQDDPRTPDEQSLVEIGVEGLKKTRLLIHTNKPWKAKQFEDVPLPYENKKDNVNFIKKEERLVVRWKMITEFETAEARLQYHSRKHVYPINMLSRRIVALTKEECNPANYVPLKVLRHSWRGEDSATCGDDVRNRNPLSTIEISDDDEAVVEATRTNFTAVKLDGSSVRLRRPAKWKQKRNAPRQRLLGSRLYTYGDLFCGSGGATLGAKLAGLKVVFGVDWDSEAAKTWRCNFRGRARHFHMSIGDFVGLKSDVLEELAVRVDVLHLSPPCQVFSPAHTREGQNDFENLTAMTSVEESLKRIRPRLVTMEETFGLLHPRFYQAFNGAIHAFTSLGYSVSWRMVNLEDYGIPQKRRRLIIQAAAPGETLPGFPPATHSKSGLNGLKKHNSVNAALARIPRNAPNHDVAFAARTGYTAAWDGSGIATCITCAGSTKGHPTQCRRFTIRELATLQTYTYDHVFEGSITSQRRQIGNSVPPQFAKVLQRENIRHLKACDTKADGVDKGDDGRPDDEVIVID